MIDYEEEYYDPSIILHLGDEGVYQKEVKGKVELFKKVSGEGLTFEVNQYGYIENLKSLLKPNLTRVQRNFLAPYFLMPREIIDDSLNENQVNRFFFHGYRLGANDIIFKTDMVIKVRIEGYLFAISTRIMTENDMRNLAGVSYDNENAVVALQGGKDLDGGYSLKLEKMVSDVFVKPDEREDVIRYRYNITSCLVNGGFGLESTNRIFKSDPPTFDDIAVEQYIRDAVYQQNGLIMIGGATGQGKSSLIGSIIDNFVRAELPRYSKFALYESPIEQTYDRLIKKLNSNVIITQSEVPFHLPSFSASARNALRRALDVAVVGESRDYETIATAIEFAQQGGLLFTTIHVNNTISELFYRTINMFPESERHTKLFEIITSMRLCVIQRLVPCLQGGRVAVREMLHFKPEIIQELMKLPNLQAVTTRLFDIVHEHGISMATSARLLYQKGKISEETLEEFIGLEKLRSIQ